MWAYVVAANDGQPITHAYFSNTYFNDNNGNYWVVIDPSTDFWCDAPSYQTGFFNTDLNDHMVLRLTYIGGWPQTH